MFFFIYFSCVFHMLVVFTYYSVRFSYVRSVFVRALVMFVSSQLRFSLVCCVVTHWLVSFILVMFFSS